jgi:hypothetical protein
MRKKGTSDTHQKRYGQYFSGAKVAELLVDLLPKDAVIKSAIDPMAGIGDLLRPVLSITKNVLAVEIDTPVAGRCAEILSASHVVNEDAFACEKIVTPDGWDLVITNPPYVRYQLQDGADGTISSRSEIRENLCRTIGNLQYLSPKDKDLLLRLAKNYSGLSDMAVPSWILCAALVKIGGLLAIVVPDTWLSREYAAPVQYMLTKCFDILTIAKDVNACWFENALVRTCLVVARRRTTLPLSEVSGDTLCLNIESNLVGEKSLIDRMLYAGNTATTALSALLEAQKDICGNGYAAVRKHTSDLFPHMLDTIGTTKWIQPEDFGAVGTGNLHPVDILSLLVNSGYSGEFFTLSDLKIDCGQGLRTGANDFFYLNIKEEKPNTYIMVSKFRQSNLREMAFPAHNIIKALRNRSQVKGLVATAADLTTGLLFVQNEIRSADKALCADSVQYAVLDNVVAEYITAAEQFRDSRGLTFKDFSAVKPNERKAGEVYTRFWYMLPALSQRHLPVLCMTRINSAQPECLFVQQANNMPIAVDANFVTMWGSNPQTIKAAFTLLNSTWARCYLEALCTVMGGGALKLEAAQLKKLKFPKYTKPELQVLAELGEELIQKGTTDDTLQKAIDQATLKPFPNPTIIGRQIEELLRKKLTERGARQ